MRKLVSILIYVLLASADRSLAFEQIAQNIQYDTINISQVSVAAPNQPRKPIIPKLETARNDKYISVKYRQTPVNIADPRFQSLDTSRSSFITGAWYDKTKTYMIIGLAGTYYHYCRMPLEAWKSFCSADSFGRHYNRFIKGRYDCRLGGVPDY